MADEARNKDPDRKDIREASGGLRRDVPSGDEQSDKNEGEPDDVAEDRNLSGSTTWLTLPDQQPSEPEEEK